MAESMNERSQERLFSKAAEAGVLGSMILDKDVVPKVMAILPTTNVFYLPENQQIYDALVSLYANGKPTDAVMLRNELEKSGRLVGVGGVEYIAKVLESVPSSANAEYYARIVKERYDYRRLVHTAEEIKKTVDEPLLDVVKQARKIQMLAMEFTPVETIIEPIDESQFKPLSSQELIETLGLTIKRDQENKLITFLCQLSAYTEGSQFNISFNAPSSTGKSYIPTEIARLFPDQDVIEIGYCSPTAFFHDVGQYVKERKGYVVDLSRKILIFLDQPHAQLLERLRPVLSHDKKEISLKITDKTQKFGLKTKNVLLRGFPAVIFCTAGLRIDEQEATRFLLLSPETNQEKIREAIYEKVRKETDPEAYQHRLEENPDRQLLKERIKAIKQANIKDIKITHSEQIEERFLAKNKILKPRHARDIGRLIALVKAFALLNVWFREREDSILIADETDVEQAFRIWDTISESQELGLPPYIYHLYQEVVLPAWYEKNKDRAEEIEEVTGKLGLSRQDIIQKHYKVYGRFIPDWQLRQQIIPMLETAGLVIQERDPTDKRKMLIYPTALLTISDIANGGNTQQNDADFLETIVS